MILVLFTNSFLSTKMAAFRNKFIAAIVTYYLNMLHMSCLSLKVLEDSDARLPNPTIKSNCFAKAIFSCPHWGGIWNNNADCSSEFICLILVANQIHKSSMESHARHQEVYYKLDGLHKRLLHTALTWQLMITFVSYTMNNKPHNIWHATTKSLSF